MKLISIFSILFLFSCRSEPSTSLAEKDDLFEENEQTIELTYIAWGCECANWVTLSDEHKYLNDDSGDTLASLSIFIEPANEKLRLPDTLGVTGDLIKFTGHFYKEKGFPAGFRSDQPVDKARVFQYTNYTVIKSCYREPGG
jgi:hypothetical protein